MNQMYTFNETAIGCLHVRNGLSCEDSSASFSADGGRYYIAATADGHGSKSCFRSGYGAQAATEAAVGCLRRFAEDKLQSEGIEKRFYEDIFTNSRYRKMAIRELTDTIIAQWRSRVLEDYEKNPPLSGEIEENADEYDESDPAHIYGTTLIAALWMPKCLILIQQGDGRCDVFYSDGSVEQPVPWDGRCEGVVTTSLCDKDAADSFRSYVVDFRNRPAAACCLGSDGIEDAYRDTYEELGGSHVLMGGVHTFYKDLLCRLAKIGQEEFGIYLKNMLPDFSEKGRFSRSGSGDDVSVAGIVDMDAVRQFIGGYEYDVKLYELEEELFWKENELLGKTRKRGILQKRADEARKELDHARAKQQALEKEVSQLKKQQEELSKKAEQTRAEVDACREESRLVPALFEGKFHWCISVIEKCVKDIAAEFSYKESSYKVMQERLDEYGGRIKQAEEARDMALQDMQRLERKSTEAQNAFEEYEARYQAIEAAGMRIKNEILALRGRK